MGEIIEGNFGRKRKIESESNSLERLDDKPSEPSEISKEIDPALISANSLRAGLFRQHEWNATNFYGLEKSKIDLIRSYKPLISSTRVEKTFADYMKTYSIKDAIAVIKNSDMGIIKSKPAFFLAMLMKLDL